VVGLGAPSRVVFMGAIMLYKEPTTAKLRDCIVVACSGLEETIRLPVSFILQDGSQRRRSFGRVSLVSVGQNNYLK